MNRSLLRVCVVVAVWAGVAGVGAASAANSMLVAKSGFTLAIEKIGPQAIPAVVLSKEGTEGAKRPAVILVHGGAIVSTLTSPGSPFKEEWFRPVYEDVPYRLAEKGMLVVAIDAAWAESRLAPDLLEQERERVMKSVFIGIFTYYLAAADDVSQVVDYLVARPDVDPNRIGVAGKSGGAITSLLAACQEPRLAAVVSWKGAADFVQWIRQRNQGVLIDRAMAENPEFVEKLKKVDPINAFDRIPFKALALINNNEDPAVPRQGAEALYEKLRPLYKDHPERLMLKLVETNKPTHDDQVEAFEAGCEWFEKHLLPQVDGHS